MYDDNTTGLHSSSQKCSASLSYEIIPSDEFLDMFYKNSTIEET